MKKQTKNQILTLSLTSSLVLSAFATIGKAFAMIDAPFLQDINQTTVDEMPINSTLKMRDKRDNKLYSVIKLSDGSVWMQNDLDFHFKEGEVLTSEDTDLNSAKNFTVPTSTYEDVASWQNNSTLFQSFNPDLAKIKEFSETHEYFMVKQLYSWNGTEGDGSDYTRPNTTNTVFVPTSFISADDGALPDGDFGTNLPLHNVGTYYNLRAATLGSMDMLEEEFSDMPEEEISLEDFGEISRRAFALKTKDSVCPRGWSLGNIAQTMSVISAVNDGEETANSEKMLNAPLYYTPVGVINGTTAGGSLLYSGQISLYMNIAPISVSVDYDKYDVGSLLALNSEEEDEKEYEGITEDDFGGPVRCVANFVSETEENSEEDVPAVPDTGNFMSNLSLKETCIVIISALAAVFIAILMAVKMHRSHTLRHLWK